MKYKAREEDPSMKEIFTWGYEAPVKNDYTKDKAELANKIRKMKRAHISENHDNYRKPEKTNDGDYKQGSDLYIFNYFDSNEIELFKKWLYDREMESEMEQRNRSIYWEHYCRTNLDMTGNPDKDFIKILNQVMKEVRGWTPAGKPSN